MTTHRSFIKYVTHASLALAAASAAACGGTSSEASDESKEQGSIEQAVRRGKPTSPAADAPPSNSSGSNPGAGNLPTTLAIGEESGGAVTLAIPEEGTVTPPGEWVTMAIPEQGSGGATSLAIGEEGGIDAGAPDCGKSDDPQQVTTMAVGEECADGSFAVTLAIGEDAGCPA